ncbi:hypothetical protein JJL52_20600 [Methylomicrobium sp. RS1]|nr:hypothetical protein [Methylomicrobium sp. RS1]
MPLRFSEPGCCFDNEKIPNGDVKRALKRIIDARFDDVQFDTDVLEMELFSKQIIKTETGYDIPMSGILIGREDVRRIFAALGLNSYPWVKMPWPKRGDELSDFPIDSPDQSKNKKGGSMADFSEKYQAKVGQTFWDKEEHDDEFIASFEALDNPWLAKIGFSKDDVIALCNKKVAPDSSPLERQNASAEIAALRPNFRDEYKVKAEGVRIFV